MKYFIDNCIYKVFSNTTFVTVLSGVLVYAISQFILEVLIVPRKKYKELIEKIAYTLTLYSCYYHNPYNLFSEEKNEHIIEMYNNASQEMRKIGAELAGYISTVPYLRKFKKRKLKVSLGCIIGISNGFFVASTDSTLDEENAKREEIIKKNLKIN